VLGPGKYDKEATTIRKATNADGVVLIIIGGNKGDGFSCQASLEVHLTLPEILKNVANQVEEDLQS